MKSLKKIMLMGLLAVMLIPTISGAASFSGTVGRSWGSLSGRTYKGGNMTYLTVTPTSGHLPSAMSFRAVDSDTGSPVAYVYNVKNMNQTYSGSSSSAVRDRYYTLQGKREGLFDTAKSIAGYWGI
ncbi:hypothetical protein [Miniphocaeibacter massiliensis]|uniref:hypothetical protein n=1 Tax=Miniphocaeibacter massiliensis TaxID=2041841 RepID=UPI000C1C3635|nr:hypothetical protein [Miniphocaeibacter massiliensis]